MPCLASRRFLINVTWDVGSGPGSVLSPKRGCSVAVIPQGLSGAGALASGPLHHLDLRKEDHESPVQTNLKTKQNALPEKHREMRTEKWDSLSKGCAWKKEQRNPIKGQTQYGALCTCKGRTMDRPSSGHESFTPDSINHLWKCCHSFLLDTRMSLQELSIHRRRLNRVSHEVLYAAHHETEQPWKIIYAIPFPDTYRLDRRVSLGPGTWVPWSGDFSLYNVLWWLWEKKLQAILRTSCEWKRWRVIRSEVW